MRKIELPKALGKRLAILIFGAFFYAAGVCVVVEAYMGISPITSTPYALSFVLDCSLGMATWWFNVVLIVLQKVLAPKEYDLKTCLLQVAICLIFSLFIDLTMYLFGWYSPQPYWGRLLYLIFGCAVLAFGVSNVVLADICVLPGEGVAGYASKLLKIEFGTAKIGFDVSSVILSVAISLIFLDRIVGVREGTVIGAILVGAFVKKIMPVIKPRLDRFFYGSEAIAEEIDEAATEAT